MMTPEIQADLRRGDSVNIGLVKDNAVKTGRPGGGGEIPPQQKKSQAKFLRIIQSEYRKKNCVHEGGR